MVIQAMCRDNSLRIAGERGIDKPIYLICHSGARSKRGAKLLQQKGYEAISVKGGMMAWHRKIIGGNK